MSLQEGSKLKDSGLKIKYMTLQPVNLNMHLPKTSFEADQFYRTINKKTPDDTGLIMDWHLNMKVDSYIKIVKQTDNETQNMLRMLGERSHGL